MIDLSQKSTLNDRMTQLRSQSNKQKDHLLSQVQVLTAFKPKAKGVHYQATFKPTEKNEG